MGDHRTLGDCLDRYSEKGPTALSVATVVDAVATASVDIAGLIGQGLLARKVDVSCGANADGDVQKDLDVLADRTIRCALRNVAVAAVASEEESEPEVHDPSARVCIAFDPLDGSSNIDINMTVGTIFSILPASRTISAAFQQVGGAQLAAGFVLYGPQTSLILTLGEGVDVFTLDRSHKVFKRVCHGMQIPVHAPEFAINASNQRHWHPAIRAFISECLAGADGPADQDFNMRWTGSLVADTYRILTRGGIFLYPADARTGYGDGRLRLVYEAHPMAFIIEQAGGAASTGYARILDLAADRLHQRVPLIMGSVKQMRRAEQLHADPQIANRSITPLFAQRGLFRA